VVLHTVNTHLFQENPFMVESKIICQNPLEPLRPSFDMRRRERGVTDRLSAMTTVLPYAFVSFIFISMFISKNLALFKTVESAYTFPAFFKRKPKMPSPTTSFCSCVRFRICGAPELYLHTFSALVYQPEL